MMLPIQIMVGESMRIALQEIIWEITGECANGCKYCGSKTIRHTRTDEKNIRKIVDAIAKFPPKELDISGGDPLLISLDTHKYVLKLLPDTQCKILINPKSLFNENGDSEKRAILREYPYFGVSVNTEEEIEAFYQVSSKFRSPNYTVVTNFNILNAYLAEEIIANVLCGRPWQIQFTIRHDEHALYNHPLAVKQLNSVLDRHPEVNVVIADNANVWPCSAGVASLGITNTGDVIPCLSMRSWLSEADLKASVQGNVLNEPLKDIWMKKFTEQRFGEFKCCKDVCNRQTLSREAVVVKYTNDAPIPIYGVQIGDPVPWQMTPGMRSPVVMMYAVSVGPLSTYGTLTTTSSSTIQGEDIKFSDIKFSVDKADTI